MSKINNNSQSAFTHPKTFLVLTLCKCVSTNRNPFSSVSNPESFIHSFFFKFRTTTKRKKLLAQVRELMLCILQTDPEHFLAYTICIHRIHVGYRPYNLDISHLSYNRPCRSREVYTGYSVVTSLIFELPPQPSPKVVGLSVPSEFDQRSEFYIRIK